TYASTTLPLHDALPIFGSRCQSGAHITHGKKTEAIDRFLTHPVVGVAAFFGVMFVVFLMLFKIAQYPMDAIDWLFGEAGTLVTRSEEHTSELQSLAYLV